VNRIKVFAGTTGLPLATQVCERLSMDLGQAEVGRFPDGEVKVRLGEDVRGADVFIINPTNPPDEHRMETILLAKACRGSSAGRITVVLPYFGYNRQDRKDRPRVPISAEVAIDQIARSGCHRVLLFDVHSEPTLAVFANHNIVVDHLYASIVAADYLKSIFSGPNRAVASTDHGGAARARLYGERVIGIEDTVIFDKQRDRESGKVKNDKIIIIGEVRGKDLLYIDDMIDTAGTICDDAKAAEKAGAKRLLVFATHGLFSGPAIDRINDSPIEEIVITNSIPQDMSKLARCRVKITVLPIDGLVARAIHNIHSELSLSELILK